MSGYMGNLNYMYLVPLFNVPVYKPFNIVSFDTVMLLLIFEKSL